MWSDAERRKNARFTVSEELLEDVAKRGAQRALECFYANFYKEVGKVTIRSVLYICGAAFTALALWLTATGKLG